MNSEIIRLIDEYSDQQDFSHAAPTQEAIARAQQQLGVELPEQYVEFLLRYGDGGFEGFEILGADLDGSMRFVEQTAEYRKLGLPNNLVVVEDCDEWVYCIDCGDGSVASWSPMDGPRTDYPDFGSFLLQRIRDSVEDM